MTGGVLFRVQWALGEAERVGERVAEQGAGDAEGAVGEIAGSGGVGQSGHGGDRVDERVRYFNGLQAWRGFAGMGRGREAAGGGLVGVEQQLRGHADQA